MRMMQLAEKSSDVRQYWAKFMDEVIHKVPKIVQRNERDVFAAMNMEYLAALVDNVRYSVKVERDEETGEFVATMEDFWFVEAGQSLEEAVRNLAEQLMDFSIDYFKEAYAHLNAPNFKAQFSKVIKALVTNDVEGLLPFFDVEYIES